MAAGGNTHRDFDRDALSEAISAVLANDIERLQRLASTRVHDYDERRSTILYFPIEKGSLEMTKILLDAGFDQEYYSSVGRTIFEKIYSPLHQALEIADPEIRRKMIRLLVESGVNPEKEYLYTESCMNRAVALGDCEMVRFLFENGCDLNYSNYSNMERTEGTEEWMIMGYYPPLHVAVGELDGDVRVEMVKLLIGLGADVDAEEVSSKKSCLHLIASQKSRTCEVLKILLDAGAELNRLDSRNSSPLAEAADHGDIELMKMMIAAGADVNFSKKCTRSPLYNAVSTYHKDAVKLLLEKGADTHIMDEDNILRIAAYSDGASMSEEAEYMDILKLLFAYGANPQCTNIESAVPFRTVLSSGSMEAMYLFFENGITLENCGVSHLLHRAAENQRRDILEYFLNMRRYNVDEIERRNDKSYTALFTAVNSCRSHNVQLLIERGADVNIPCIDKSRDREKPSVTSPLYEAIASTNRESVDLLLSSGANMNADTGFETLHTITSAVRESEEYYDVLVSLTAEIALLKSQGFSSEDETNIIMREFANRVPEIEEQCLCELEELKTVIFHDSCTLYDLLRGKDIARYVRNSKVADNFESLRVIERFPMYGNRIMICYSLAKAKRDWMDEASKGLSDVVLKFQLCNRDDILFAIASPLSLKDLRTLCDL